MRPRGMDRRDAGSVDWLRATERPIASEPSPPPRNPLSALLREPHRMKPDQQFWNDFARRREGDWCAALSRLLSHDTTSGDASPEGRRRWLDATARAFDFLDGLARAEGLVTRSWDHRVLVLEMPGPPGAPVLGVPVHVDVVPAGEGWTHPPFSGALADGHIWGRGAQDDKGPAVQTLFGLLGAIELARLTDRTFKKTVRIVVVSEEELGLWDDIPFYFERERPPDFSIVPDASFPITNGEKGFVNLMLRFSWPAPCDRLSLVSGERPNVVPFRAELEVGPGLLDSSGIGPVRIEAEPLPPKQPEVIALGDGSTRVVFHGVGAHGSRPELGVNAAADALAFASGLPGLRGTPAGAAFDWLARAARAHDGETLGIRARHEKVGATTVNPGVVRADARGLEVTLNIRNPIGLSCDEVAARVRAAAEALVAATPGLSVERCELGADRREPIYVDPERFAEWIEPMRAAYSAVTDRPATLESIGGTTFAKAFPNAVCFGPVDPGDGEPELAHQTDERISLAAMRRNVEIYGRAFAALALDGARGS